MLRRRTRAESDARREEGVRASALHDPGGALLRNVRIGWESYGRLNRDRSNVILVTHYFSATSHAAGRYAADDALPGYWDAIIGPGKAIDTDKYFVLSSDTLVNLNARDPNVVTTGPASAPALPGRDPAQALSHRFMIEDALDQLAALRAGTADANNFLYLIRANQLAGADPSRIRAPTLLLYSPTDLLFPQPWIERTAAAIRGAGTPVDMAPLHGPNGHLNGVLHIGQASARVAAFLAA